jgi:SAM-dependent methyltransferase
MLIEADRDMDTRLADRLRNSLAMVRRVTDRSWEWEDEEYWTSDYERWLRNTKTKDWNDRLWQRDLLIRQLRLREHDLAGKVIADVGSGEGQTFRHLIAPLCDAETLYVAIDISLAALRLNRRLNPHVNSAFILSVASPLPLRTSSVDIALYFGILHHAPRKESSLCMDASVIKAGGYVLLHEALDRPRLLPLWLPAAAAESVAAVGAQRAALAIRGAGE